MGSPQLASLWLYGRKTPTDSKIATKLSTSEQLRQMHECKLHAIKIAHDQRCIGGVVGPSDPHNTTASDFHKLDCTATFHILDLHNTIQQTCEPLRQQSQLHSGNAATFSIFKPPDKQRVPTPFNCPDNKDATPT